MGHPIAGNRFTQISLAEREIIRKMLTQKHRVREIANLLGKHRSTIFRELRRNTNAGGLYDARAKFRIIENDLTLEAYVEKLLKFGLSPDQIAGYMARSRHERPVSYRTVYRWVHRAWQNRKALLRFRGKPRAPYGSRMDAWDPNKRHIRERPAVVEKRERIGDWEVDLVHCTQDDSRHCLLTLNDRATGFCIIQKVVAIDSYSVAYKIIAALSGLPVRTITCDNGFEFGRHKFLERKFEMQSVLHRSEQSPAAGIE
jgi:IS30 family transposase